MSSANPESMFSEMTRKTIPVLFSSFCPLLLLSVLWMFVGDGDESNLGRAKVAAKRGDEAAEYFVGKAYFQGRVLTRIIAGGGVFSLRCGAGECACSDDLGVMFESGLGVEQNLTEAFTWFTRSAEQGDPNGQYNLGRMYATGSGV